jgi:hypothetical protein
VKLKLRRIFLLFIAGALLLATGLATYAAHIRSAAQALINSATEIHSTADAERQIAAWRERSDRSFWQKTSAEGGDHTYDIHVENGLLHRLHITPPTMVGMTIGMRNEELRYVTLTMFTGRSPNSTSGVWVQEWFGPVAANSLHVNETGKPWKATVDFSSALPEAQRGKAFSLNAKCFVRPGGCKSAEEILPTVWQLAAPVSSNVYPQSYP